MLVTLKFLAKDFSETDYHAGSDCAITRALHRGGNPHLFDEGIDIIDTVNNISYMSDPLQDYRNMVEQVLNMYAFVQPEIVCQSRSQTRLEPQDFECTLELVAVTFD